jgi:hypothetical protein
MKSGWTRVYQFQKAEHACTNLRDKHIKTSVFGKVNDKRELRAYTIEGWEKYRDWLCKFLTYRFTIHCFAQNCVDKGMWNEYGDGGRGICLGLDIRSEIELREVCYVRDEKVGKFPDHLDKAFREALRTGELPQEYEQEGVEHLKNFVLTKFDDYSQESEVRAFDIREYPDERGFYFDSFSETMALREVILGPDCCSSVSII